MELTNVVDIGYVVRVACSAQDDNKVEDVETHVSIRLVTPPVVIIILILFVINHTPIGRLILLAL